MRAFGRGQLFHVLFFALLFSALWLTRSLWGLNRVWSLVIISVSLAVAHQVWVAVCWGLELYHGVLSRLMNRRAFAVYATGFVILIIARFAPLAPIALQTRGSLALSPWTRGILAALIVLISSVALHSVLRFFGARRALGIDHFDPSYRSRPLETRGVYRYTGNAMYIMVLLLIYLPAVIWGSLEALVVGVFHHTYVWVHYYCTERPDMSFIYGKTGEKPGQDTPSLP